MNAPAIFQNDEFQLRVTATADSFRVEASGVAKALGFHSARDLVRSIPEDEKGWEIAPTPGGDQRVWYLTEAGFYRALGQRQPSRIKDAGVRAQVERFQRFVYGDVLPTIRRTGTYSTPGTPAADLTSPLGVLALAEEYRAAALQLVGVQQRVAELEPAAEAWETLGEGGGNYSLREAAAILCQDPAISTGSHRLMAFIRDEGLVDPKGRPYSKFSRFLVQKPMTYTHPHSGEIVLKAQLRVTPDGVAFLHRRLGGIREVAA